MSGVLGGGGGGVAAGVGIGNLDTLPFGRPGLRKGGEGGRRKRPKKLHRQRPLRQRRPQFDYYDYDYGDYSNVPEPRGRFPQAQKPLFKQKSRPNGGIARDHEPSISSVQVSYFFPILPIKILVSSQTP